MPRDFLLWGYIKNKVFYEHFKPEFYSLLIAAFNNITPHMISPVFDSNLKRDYLGLTVMVICTIIDYKFYFTVLGIYLEIIWYIIKNH